MSPSNDNVFFLHFVITSVPKNSFFECARNGDEVGPRGDNEFDYFRVGYMMKLIFGACFFIFCLVSMVFMSLEFPFARKVLFMMLFCILKDAYGFSPELLEKVPDLRERSYALTENFTQDIIKIQTNEKLTPLEKQTMVMEAYLKRIYQLQFYIAIFGVHDIKTTVREINNLKPVAKEMLKEALSQLVSDGKSNQENFDIEDLIDKKYAERYNDDDDSADANEDQQEENEDQNEGLNEDQNENEGNVEEDSDSDEEDDKPVPTFQNAKRY